MTFLELAKKRCSVRNYSSRNVELEKINGLLTAIQLAPSAVNLQPWRVYVVVNEKKKKELQACYDRDWFRTAPVYIVICGNRAESWKRRDGKDHCDVDIAI
ncbi:MAG: nitroreductase family protein, partial [Paludibacteraceae bacterium]